MPFQLWVCFYQLILGTDLLDVPKRSFSNSDWTTWNDLMPEQMVRLYTEAVIVIIHAFELYVQNFQDFLLWLGFLMPLYY